VSLVQAPGTVLEAAAPAVRRVGLLDHPVHGRARSVVVDANRLTANRLDGLRVSSGATQVTASRNLIDFHHRAGVFLAEGAAEIGPANRLLDNEMASGSPATPAAPR
jgi:hypothetical protein